MHESSAGAAAPMRAALDAELARLERVASRVLSLMALASTALGLVIGLTLSAPLGLGLAALGAPLALWFFAFGHALSRGRVGPKLRVVGTLVEAAMPWVAFVITAQRQGPLYALASWVPPSLFFALVILSLARLRPRACLIHGAIGAVALPTLYLALLHPELPADGGELLFAGPWMQLSRAFTMLLAGGLSAMLARGLRRAIGRAGSHVRAQDLFGKYRLTREIAQGGMGVVYEALYCPEGGFERRVAVKRVHPHLAATARFVAAFREEARLSACLAHPGIVQVLDFGRIDDSYFLVLEYVEGITLGALMRRVRSAGLELPPELVGHVLRELLLALAHAHEGARDPDGHPLRVVHRDLCPPNVLVSRNGEVKITDFGIARSLSDAAASLTKHVDGHTGYMAPEQARAEPFDARADLFPLGVIAWELFGQRPLFASDSDAASLAALLAAPVVPISALRPDLDPAWDELLARALARDPAERFARATDMLHALDAIPGSCAPAGAERLGKLLRELADVPSMLPPRPDAVTAVA
ncbi:MAG: serine/threonine protein kinase [Myxococcales bacterium]|nr:serine/threonine protein kinase [Myxococcales bacterium]